LPVLAGEDGLRYIGQPSRLRVGEASRPDGLLLEPRITSDFSPFSERFYHCTVMEMWFRAWAGSFNHSSFFPSLQVPILHRLLLTMAICWACSGPTGAADPSDRANRVVHATPAQAAERLAAFQLAPGFKIDLIATEPMVSAPVAIAFDENGRLF